MWVVGVRVDGDGGTELVGIGTKLLNVLVVAGVLEGVELFGTQLERGKDIQHHVGGGGWYIDCRNRGTGRQVEEGPNGVELIGRNKKRNLRSNGEAHGDTSRAEVVIEVAGDNKVEGEKGCKEVEFISLSGVIMFKSLKGKGVRD